MGIIQTLDIQLTNMIAAGEVVERPMGIIKELVENSIDAQATRIEVSVVQGGIQSIEIIDNGIGMDGADATMAFKRHATSKIHKTQDLWSIKTLGFRGEALPSISSVSEVSLETNDGKEATKVEIHYGELVSAKPFPCNQGTCIRITGLFHKTPARLKHLKTVAYENSLVSDVIQKFALSHPEIAFTLISDGKETFRTTGSNDIVEVLYQIYGKEVAKNAMTVDVRDADYEIKGVCIHPQFTRATRNSISIFLNGRMVRPYRVQKALVDSYANYIPSDRYPIVVLNIKMDSQLVDVNVHPSKWEVRLSKEQQLEHLIKTSLPKVLSDYIQAPEIKLERVREEKIVHQSFFDEPTNQSEPIQPKLQVEEMKSEYKQEEQPVYVKEVEAMVEEKTETITALPKREFPILRLIGQMHGKYILCEGDQGLYIIDQHAAQERVHYEQFLDKLEATTHSKTPVLVPYHFHVSNDLVKRIEELNALTSGIGIEFETFGQDSLIIREIPLWLKNVEEEVFLQDLLDKFKDESEISKVKIHKDKIATMACHHSIRFNRYLSEKEMNEVIEQLKECKQPYHCPHGRPTFICLDATRLEKEFYR